MNQMYQIHVKGHDYREIMLHDSKTFKPISINKGFDAVRHKLFHQDIFQCAADVVNIVHSSIRKRASIPGVLILQGNRMYGRHKKKRLYKCIPDDRRLPIFLIPYQLRLSFEKHLQNKYIIFRYQHWEEEHPRGSIVQIIGDVNQLINFYEYQLYCKSLYASIQNFRKCTIKSLKTNTKEHFIQQITKQHAIEDRSNWEVITIDPNTSKDFDDAFSIKELSDTYILSIYISNVSFWLDMLDVWDSFSQRIATIYLPDRRRPMLPTILSEALCSLQAHHSRFAFTLDVTICKETFEIKSTRYCNAKINVHYNHAYDTRKMEQSKLYQQCFKLITSLNVRYKYMGKIATSHDMIAYCMILMNYLSAKEMCKHGIGLYRSVKNNPATIPPKNTPIEFQKFIKMWYSSGSHYVSFQQLERHDLLDLDAYIHITSPIRRLVDLLNMLALQDVLGLFPFTEKSKQFYTKWTDEKALAYINETMRSIRRVQNDCALLSRCYKEQSDRLYSGIIFDKMKRSDSLFQYMVYLTELKMVNRFIAPIEHAVHSQHDFKVYIFMDEDRCKQKIRLELQYSK